MTAADTDRDLTPTERALATVRLAVFAALQAGATRHDIDREAAEAGQYHLRFRHAGAAAAPVADDLPGGGTDVYAPSPPTHPGPAVFAARLGRARLRIACPEETR